MATRVLSGRCAFVSRSYRAHRMLRARAVRCRFSPQGSHTVRAGAGGRFPHLGHSPCALSSAVRLLDRSWTDQIWRPGRPSGILRVPGLAPAQGKAGLRPADGPAWPFGVTLHGRRRTAAVRMAVRIHTIFTRPQRALPSVALMTTRRRARMRGSRNTAISLGASANSTEPRKTPIFLKLQSWPMYRNRCRSFQFAVVRFLEDYLRVSQAMAGISNEDRRTVGQHTQS